MITDPELKMVREVREKLLHWYYDEVPMLEAVDTTVLEAVAMLSNLEDYIDDPTLRKVLRLMRCIHRATTDAVTEARQAAAGLL